MKAALEIALYACTQSRFLGGASFAAALTSCGIVHTLQGNCSEAMVDLFEASRVAHEDPALRFLARTYIHFAKRINYDMLPELGTGDARDIKYRFVKSEIFPEWYLRSSEPDDVHKVDYLLYRECELVHAHMRLMSVPRQDPDPPYPLSSARTELLRLVEEDDRDLAILGTHQRGLSSFRHEKAKLLFRYSHKEEARHILDSVRAYYEQTNDLVGLGNINLTLGDWLVAPLSCPEVWNCFLDEGRSDNSLHWQVEAAETAIDLNCIQEARRHYEAPLQLFTSGNRLRGVAAVRMRLGYLSALKGLAVTDVEFEKHFAVARLGIQAAAAMFYDTGDIMAFQLCQAHLSLCDVGEKQGPDDLQRAVNIGRWGCTDGSFGYALGIGLLFARMGRRWRNHIGDYERAFTCFRLAEALFKHLRAGLCHIHAIADQMNLYEMLRDFHSFSRLALVALDECAALQLQQPSIKDRIEEVSRWILIRIIGTAMSRKDPTLVDHALDYVSTHLKTDLPDKATKFPNLDNIATALSEIQVSEHPEPITKAMNDILKVFSVNQMAQEVLMSAVTDSKVYMEFYRGMDHKRAGNVDKAGECFRSFRTNAQAYDDARRYHLEALSYAGEGDYVRASTANKMSLKLRMNDLDLREEARESTWVDPDSRRHAAVEALMAFIEFDDYGEVEKWMHFLNEHFSEWWASESSPWEAIYYMGRTQEGIGDMKSALICYEDAISVFERHRENLSIGELKLAFSGASTTQKMFFAYTRTLFKMRNQPESSTLSAKEVEAKIFEVVERGRARSLLDLMQGGLLGSGQVAGSSAFRRWRQLHASRSMHCTLLEQKLRNDKADQNELTHLKESTRKIEAQIRIVEREIQSSGSTNKACHC
jgi:tetratricopeptide (TPR) repeat protein